MISFQKPREPSLRELHRRWFRAHLSYMAQKARADYAVWRQEQVEVFDARMEMGYVSGREALTFLQTQMNDNFKAEGVKLDMEGVMLWMRNRVMKYRARKGCAQNA